MQSAETSAPPVNDRLAAAIERENKVLEAARDKWHYIFAELAPNLINAIELAPEHVSCPVHGGNDGFRLFSDYNETGGGICNTCNKGRGFRNGLALLAWAKSYKKRDAVREVAEWLKLDESKAVPRKNIPLKDLDARVDRVKAAKSIYEVWHKSVPLTGAIGEKYLVSRGIWSQNIPTCLRFVAKLPYWHKVNKEDKRSTYFGDFPAILTPIRNASGKLVSIHRTFVSIDGASKAPVPDCKKLMTGMEHLTGSIARLFPPSEDPELKGILGIAEGLETCLSVRAITGMPVWMGVSATLMQGIDIPDWVTHLVIWADLDTSRRGEEAADLLADIAEKRGIKVTIYFPNFKLTSEVTTFDWNDVLVNQGISGFPAKWRRWRPPVTIAA